MNIVFTILAAVPLGFWVKQRGTAVVAYLALEAIVFAFQSVGVLLSWMANKPPVAFGPSPRGGFPVSYSTSEMWGYGVINLVITAVGVGLVALGAWLRARRQTKRNGVNVA